MNNTRRKAINNVAKNIETVTSMIEEIMSKIEDIVEEENEAVENIPDNFQDSFDYDSSEAALQALDDVSEDLTDVLQSLESASSWIQDALF